jgi:hypothetical protein
VDARRGCLGISYALRGGAGVDERASRGGLGTRCGVDGIDDSRAGIEEVLGNERAIGATDVTENGELEAANPRGFGVAFREGIGLGVACRVGDSVRGRGVWLWGGGESGAMWKYCSFSPSSEVIGETSPSCKLDNVEEVVDALSALFSGVAGRKDGRRRFFKNDGVRGRFGLSEATSLPPISSGSGTEPICGVVGRESRPFRKDLRPMA